MAFHTAPITDLDLSPSGKNRGLSYLKAAGLRLSRVKSVPTDVREACDVCESEIAALPERGASAARVQMKPAELELSFIGRGMVAFMKWRQSDPDSAPILASAGTVAALACLVLTEAIF